ncbi:nuclear transport factor 2 family protein [Henriciella sp. AS95]|uniref:YybH family protein n=1 Tax=Henriciella sp. AS95 TaxID=3135782 RepID=UPI0031750F24
MRQAFAAALISCALVFTACSHTTPPPAPVGFSSADEAAIRSLLSTQDGAWNAGDIDGFMEGYWVSPDLRFASGGTVTRGYQETLDRYKARYSNRALMGTLSFDELEVVPLASDAAAVHGRWLLTRANDAPSGLFTLILRKIQGDWKIISDTTTSAD